LIQNIGKQIAERTDIVGPNLKFQANVIVFDVIFGDRVGEHRLAAHDSIGYRRSGA